MLTPRRRDTLGYFALALAALTAAGVFWYVNFVPHSFRLAVPPAESEIGRAVEGLSGGMQRDRTTVRVSVVNLQSFGEVAAALDNGRANLILARTDQPLPNSALAVAQFHEFVTVLLTDPDAKIAKFGDLQNRRLGELTRTSGGTGALAAMLRATNLNSNAPEIIPIDGISGIAEAVSTNKVDALFLALPRGSSVLSAAVQAYRRAIGKTPAVVALSEAPSLALRNPAFAAGEIAAGELSSEPLLPAQAVKTVTFPLLLMAHRDLSSASVNELTKQIFVTRQSIVANYPAAGRIAALPTARGSAFSLHPGAIVYYNATETTFLSRYSDVIWLLLFGFSTIVSLGIALMRLLFPHQRELIRAEHQELKELIAKIRKARSVREIDEVETRVDELVGGISQLVFEGKLDSEQQPAFDILIARIGEIASAKRESLKTES